MRRREFITLVGGAAVVWPLAARAQQGERVRRVGMLLPATPDDSEYPMLVKAFVAGLQQLGWTEGRNIRIDIRWAGGGADANRRYAEELVKLAPDVIMASGNASAGPMLQATRTIPIVFAIVPDPVGAGLVDSLGRPSGNATGFTSFAYDIGGKWLGLLKEIAPHVTARSRYPGFHYQRWSWSVECHSNGGTIIRGGGDTDQLEQRRRAGTRYF